MSRNRGISQSGGPGSPGSPQIFEYLKKFQEDPTSRVFAPLAESYRKAGLVDEAIEIAREGLRFHSGFVGGRVALARALFDKKLYHEVLDELGAVVRDVPDNLVAQRLVAESHLMMGRISEALAAYKMLLYFSPHDADTAHVVRELETQAYEKGLLVLRTDQPEPLPNFAVQPAQSAISANPEVRKNRWIGQVESLQQALGRIERYREQVRSERGPRDPVEPEGVPAGCPPRVPTCGIHHRWADGRWVGK